MRQIFLLIALISVSVIAAAQEIDENSIPDQYIVQLKGGVDGEKFFAPGSDIRIIRCLSKSMDIWLVKSETPDILNKLKASPSVKVVQYDHRNIIRRNLVPNDSLFNLQWNMFNTGNPGADISATEAWQLNHSNVTQAGDSIVIAIVDGGGVDSADGGSSGPGVTTNGFDINHKDINFFVNHHEIPNNGIDDDGNGYVDDYLGWSVFSQNDSVFNVGNGDVHSTHVSGIAGAIGNNTIGVAGVSWGAKIMPVVGASNYESDVVSAYDYVLEMRRLYDQTHGVRGAFVVATNSSFGVGVCCANPANYPIWCAMYDSMGAYGILSAIAVPDEAVNVDQVNDVPTGCPSKWMIAVTNTTQSDQLNGAAGYGPTTVDIGAPGTAILSCFPDNSYGYDDGTSMSSPHLAGAIAALYANACPSLLQAYFAHPDSVALLMESYLLQSADPLYSLQNITTSGGRLNLYHAFVAEDGYNCNNCNYNVSLSQQNLACAGDSTAFIYVSAGNDNAKYHFLWTNGDSTNFQRNLGPGFYMVTITDSTGCQRQLSTLIPEPQAIVINSITINPITPGSVGNIIVNASAGSDSMYYSLDGGSYQAEAVFADSVPGLHYISIMNQSGCVYDTFVSLTVAGIANETSAAFVRLLPNPVSGTGMLTISSSGAFQAGLQIHDLTGRMVLEMGFQITGGIQQEPLDLSTLSDGVYLMTLTNKGKAMAEMKVLVINHE